MTDDGRQLPLPTRKDRLLLAYLALSPGRAHPRERLAGLVWSDRAAAQARDSLKQSLASIRQTFRQVGLDPLCADRDSAALEADRIGIDAIEFARFAATSMHSERAAALYQGELLEGIDGLGSDLETWLRAERERLTDLAVRVLEELAIGADHDGATDDAVRLGRHLLAHDPLREPVYRALMRLMVRHDERAAALKLYATCREALKRDLGVAPDIKTEDLYRDILTDRLPQASATSQAAPSSDRPSVAVLPFSNLGGDSDLGRYCEGATEDIITGLGRFRMLFVIDRQSSVAVAQQTTDLAEIGRRLGVAYLVQGSLQRLGERVRITVRLVEARSRTQLWADAFDLPASDILAISDKITGSIISRLHDRIESSLVEQCRRKPKLAAYECVLRGVKHLRGYGADDNKRAVEMFQQAMELDPDYALARAYRAFADVVLHGYADAPDAILAGARSLAQTAVAMDDDDGRCHWLLGMIYGYSGNLKAEVRHYEQALALNPNDANAMAASGVVLAALGRAEEGIDRIREAMRLNPYHTEWYWMDLGMTLYLARRYADAVEAFGHRTQPGPWTLCRIAACYAQIGQMEEAHAATAEALRQQPDFSLSKLRLPMWNASEAQHLLEGMRRAGLPD
jgi:TolB-like protein/Tfp pilus assembly protein PilF